MRAAVMLSTRNLYADIAPPVKALLMHSDVEKIYLLIEDRDPGIHLPPECECIDISGWKDRWKGTPNAGNSWTWIVLMRSLFYRLFTDLDRILSLDLDAFALKDVSELWRLPLGGKLVAAVEETTPLSRPEFPYFNAGVMMLNLELLRETGRGADIERALRKRAFAYPEQTAFNLLCSGSVHWLPREWNAGKGTEPYGDPVIRHFMAESLTYRDGEIYEYYRDLPWEMVRRRPGRAT